MSSTLSPESGAPAGGLPLGLAEAPVVPRRLGKVGSLLRFLWSDHAYLRLGFSNAHWVDANVLRTNQPWPFQLARWKKRGIRTVVNLRGDGKAFYDLEERACARLGLTFETFRLTSHSLPRSEEFLAAKALFERIEYPALIHCKSGADRAGIMSALYCHFQCGQPIAEARKQLALRYLHFGAGPTGVLDHLFAVYLRDVEPRGVSFLDWVKGPDYDFKTLSRSYRPSRWGALIGTVLRRE